MGYERLSLNGFIQEMKNVTYGTHPRRFCFVLGAGASRTSGIKSGQELVRVWDRELRERNEEDYLRWRNVLGITEENMSNFYSYYYEKRFHRCPADGLSYIEGIMESAKPSAGYVMLAHILTETPHNVVVTTNFDHLTEDAVTYYAQKTPLVVGHEALSRYVVGQQVRSTIIKIHRDLLFDPKSRTEDIEKLPDSWVNALARVFENYHPVFVGYAGNDKSLMDFLIDNSENFANNQWKYPYWLLYKNDSLDGKVREFLEKSDGIFIHHNGFDEVMIELGAAFDYQIPEEEKFLEDAVERYRMLRDAIDAFTDKSNPEPDKKPQVDIDEKVIVSPESLPTKEENAIGEAINKITSQSELQNMYHRATIYIKDGNYTGAVELLTKLIELDPENIRYRYTLGRALYFSGQNEEAIIVANEILKDNPDYALAHFLIGKAYGDMNRHEDALKAYHRAAECSPEQAAIYFSIGEEMGKLNRLDESIEYYRKAIELDPEWARPHFRIGEVLDDNDSYEEALEEFKQAVKLEPDNALYHVSIGMILGKLGKSEDALDAFKKAIVVSPDWDVSYFLMAGQLKRSGRYEEALDYIKKAVELDPNEAPYYECQASILTELGRHEEAKIALATCQELEDQQEE